MRVAGTQKGKRGQVRTEEAELAITISFLRRTLSEAGVRRVLSRLKVIGPCPELMPQQGDALLPSTSK